MRSTLILIAAFLFTILTDAQNCDCLSKFEWVKKTFEENDAGFEYALKQRGVLDISNMYYVESPCGEFELGYSLSRSMRIPEFSIDDKGIQPDYYLDKGIPEHKWVNYVNDILNE
ncbi:MAG: hypothetical protein K0B08_07315 [Bacteroidales bacterium]|nr:hypothetical protein [Bacteroidales bacterium]